MAFSLAGKGPKRTLALKEAVHRNRAASLSGALERLFTLAFSGLVYPQIWEDPVVDLLAMEIKSGHRIVTIASGGCNALSYLTSGPREILAVDLNPAHIALTRLKIAAAQHLPRHADFLRFFGNATSASNIASYDAVIRRHLDAETQAYWDASSVFGRRRIEKFASGFYRHGLLGAFIGLAHVAARLAGVRPQELLTAETPEAQRMLFEARLAPIFDRPLVRWLTSRKACLYGLGIPPAQFEKLSNGRAMAEVLRDRLRKLACDFPIGDNYFAWQAFARRYAEGPGASLPPYLEAQNFAAVRSGAKRVRTEVGSLTDILSGSPAGNFDRYVLLDAQDWMDEEQINALWVEMTRTARPGARVIFRTAGESDIVGTSVRPGIRGFWSYDAERSKSLSRLDRSAVYGAFHLYRLKGDSDVRARSDP